MNIVQKILLVFITLGLWLISNLHFYKIRKDIPFQKFRYGQRFPVESVTHLYLTLKTTLL
jgi:hypothetical protein